ncbi:FAD-dependent thymidylate synthase [Bradyrhizobium sp. PMVTL-01]|uniref:FAD-dependent thymidylate synthase n=1 Tax=Bradyrhizobium sp. PMVTL-01 TaxID=3434999 RepID=UPI003F6F3188
MNEQTMRGGPAAHHNADVVIENGVTIKDRDRAAADTLNRIDVLDHGYVRLVDHMGSDLSVVRAARVSYDAAWRAGEDQGSDFRLINYLWKNHHTSPFEAVTFTFEVKAPIFVFRQWHRHRTWSFNELSARYRELPEEFYVPKPEHIGIQSTENKQGRSLVYEQPEQREIQSRLLRKVCEDAFATYRDLLSMDWPRELARSVLPVATYSHMFATVDLLNLMKFLTLRDHGHAQMEIRVYAEAMRELIRPIVPTCVKAWEAHR